MGELDIPVGNCQADGDRERLPIVWAVVTKANALQNETLEIRTVTNGCGAA
jgi:hypothetical protein